MSSFTTIVIHTASQLPKNVWDTMMSDPMGANIILAPAIKAAKLQSQAADQYWVILNGGQGVDFLLSCTSGPLGDYPIFIFTPRQVSELTRDFLEPRLTSLITALRTVASGNRVFSVFSLDPVARTFAELWEQSTGIKRCPVPYYSALLTYCVPEKLAQSANIELGQNITYELRRAMVDDIPEAAQLCYKFAKGSEPFTLTQQAAEIEARTLVEGEQLWVHTITLDGRCEIASIVATSREGGPVTAITKVFTNPEWRGNRCADRLVRHVCDTLFTEKKVARIVLYVAHDNPRASKVYHRVGFAGLDPTCPDPSSLGVHTWTEIGFDRKIVKLGHW